MELDQSLHQALRELITLQAQQLNAINGLSHATKNNQALQGQASHPSISEGLKDINLNSYSHDNPFNTLEPDPLFSKYTDDLNSKFRSHVKNGVSDIGNINVMNATNSSMVSGQTLMSASAEQASRRTNAILTGVSAGGAIAGDLAVSSMVPGFFGSMAAGAAGGLLIGGTVAIGADQTQQHLAYNRYLLDNSYRFINPLESDNDRDVAGFSQEERWDASKFLRHLNTEVRMDDKEVMGLLSDFTEGGLMKEARDLETFKSKMTSLTDYVKKGALILNESYKDITSLMAEMNKSGITSENFTYFASKNKILGSFMGVSGSDALGSVFNISGDMTGGTDYNRSLSMEATGDMMLYMNEIYDNAREKRLEDPRQQEIYNLITNMGGIEAATKVAMAKEMEFSKKSTVGTYAVNFFDYDESTRSFKFNKDTFDSIMSGDMGYSEYSNRAMKKLSDMSLEEKDLWLRNSDTYLHNSLGSEMTRFIHWDSRKQAEFANLDPNMNSKEVFAKMYGDNSDYAKLYGALMDYRVEDNDKLIMQSKALTLQQNMLASINANNPGILYDMKMGWDSISDTLGDAFTPLGQFITESNTKLNDWLYGKQYTSDMSDWKTDWSQDFKKEGKDAILSLLEGVKEGASQLKSAGFEVSDTTRNLIENKYLSAAYDSKHDIEPVANLISGSTYSLDSLQRLYESGESALSQHIQEVGTIEARLKSPFTRNKYAHLQDANLATLEATGVDGTEILSSLADVFNLDFDGSARSRSRLALTMASEYTRLESAMNEWAESSDKKSTMWGQMSFSDKIAAGLIMDNIYLTSGESMGLNQMNLLDFLSDSEKEKVRPFYGTSKTESMRSSASARRGGLSETINPEFHGANFTSYRATNKNGLDEAYYDPTRENIDDTSLAAMYKGIFSDVNYKTEDVLNAVWDRGSNIQSIRDSINNEMKDLESQLSQAISSQGRIYRDLKSSGTLGISDKSVDEDLVQAALQALETSDTSQLESLYGRYKSRSGGVAITPIEEILATSRKQANYDVSEFSGILDYLDTLESSTSEFSAIGGSVYNMMGMPLKSSSFKRKYSESKLKKMNISDLSNQIEQGIDLISADMGDMLVGVASGKKRQSRQYESFISSVQNELGPEAALSTVINPLNDLLSKLKNNQTVSSNEYEKIVRALMNTSTESIRKVEEQHSGSEKKTRDSEKALNSAADEVDNKFYEMARTFNTKTDLMQREIDTIKGSILRGNMMAPFNLG